MSTSVKQQPYTLRTVIISSKEYITLRYVKTIDIIDGKLHICVLEDDELVTYVCSQYYFGIAYP